MHSSLPDEPSLVGQWRFDMIDHKDLNWSLGRLKLNAQLFSKCFDQDGAGCLRCITGDIGAGTVPVWSPLKGEINLPENPVSSTPRLEIDMALSPGSYPKGSGTRL